MHIDAGEAVAVIAGAGFTVTTFVITEEHPEFSPVSV
jgi:hypothetical protein